MRKKLLHIASLAVFVALFGQSTFGQSTEFTYQGRLLSGGLPANGAHDFEFRLFRDSNGNELVGTPRALTDVNVNNGVFSVRLDFGDEFPGENRYLEIRVRQAGQQFFTVLAPLQAITSAPYAIKSLNAENATNSTNSTNAAQLGGVDATQYVLTVDPRMTDARTPLPNSANYIQNSTGQQASSNFNITGTGTAGILDARTQFNLGGARILSNQGQFNLFAGVGAGTNTTAQGNSYFGAFAGDVNITGIGNSFFGARAGANNFNASSNSFFGADAGLFSSTGNLNSFFGSNTGVNNGSGNSNSLFGAFADIGNGRSNATAIGYRAFVGQNNSLILGSINGVNGATADTNVGIGTTTPGHRLHVVGNGLFTGNLTVNGTFNAAGATLSGSIVNAATQYNIAGMRVFTVSGPSNIAGLAFSASNTFVGESTGLNSAPDPSLSSSSGKFNSLFGSNAGKATTTGFNNSFFGARAGEANVGGSNNSFFGMRAGVRNSEGAENSFVGIDAGSSNTGGSLNTFLGSRSGLNNVSGSSNSFVGSFAGSVNTTGSNNTILGSFANLGANNLTNATAIGAHARVDQSNALVLGSINGVNSATADTRVGIGTASPTAKLTISGHGAFNSTSAARFDLFNTTATAGFLQHVTNTGLWQLATTTGTTRMVVDASGNVGVGTTSPTSRLTTDGEITSMGGTGGRFAANNPNNQSARVLFDWINDGTTDWPRIRYGGNGSGSGNGFLIQGPGEVTKFAVLDTGKVSIPASLTVGTTANVQLGNSGCAGTPGSIPGAAIGFNGVSCANYSLGGDGSNTFIKAPSGAISFLVAGNEAIRVASTGRVSINLPGSGGSTTLCLNSSNQISFCSSSARYKQNILPFTAGLNLIKRLRPVSFNWRSDNSLDFGLVAEEIAEAEPLLVTRNRTGAIEGVKYDRVSVVLVNAVQEQQQQIEGQKKQIEGQNHLIQNQTAEIEDLKKQIRQQTDLVENLRKLFCESHPQKDVCKE